MHPNRVPIVTFLAALLLSVGFTTDAHAVPISACVAGDIIAGDPGGCPSSGLCTITKIFSVGNGCVLDFGTRDVTIAASGELRIAGAKVTLETGNFTVVPGALVDGATTTVGGSFTVQATGDIAVQKGSTTAGRILVNGEVRGGSILLYAGGDIKINGQLQANNRLTLAAAGGDIMLRAGGDIVTGTASIIDPHGGTLAYGGFLDLLAAGLIDIGNSIDNTGGDGGSMNITAGDKVIIRDQLKATGEGDAGSGGDIDIIAGTDVEIYANVLSLGTDSGTGSGGGDGGAVFITAGFGDITLGGDITVRSGYPDGGGGDIELFAEGSIDVQPVAEINASGIGPDSWGGEILLGARIDVTINGPLQAEAGDSGGEVGIEAGRDIALNALLNARSTRVGSFGGSVSIEAGLATSGNLTLAAVIDVSGPICDAYGFCSLGGDVDASACDLTLQTSGMIQADALGSGGNGGAIFLTARDQLRILGSLDATGGGGSLDGSNTLIHPVGISPIVTGSVSPPPTMTPHAMCTGGTVNPPSCLIPCPTCGNGVTEFPETCDTSGTPVSCDGCSRFCEIEPQGCNDQSVCTIDSCDPILGCRHQLMPAGTLCRDAAGPCDLPETCTGASQTCPANAFEPGTTECRASTGACDPAETCTGSNAACPANALWPSGTVCRASTGACDIAETCTGSSAACPANTLQPTGTVCRPVAGTCDQEETCSGASPTCPANAFRPATIVCRVSADICDIEETCPGTGPTCPADAFKSGTTVCRASAGICDIEETCTGAGPTCPTNALKPGTTVCRASAGACDVADRCNGSEPTCPADALESTGTVCRPAGGDCDVEETCTGASPTCPTNAFEPAGTSCDDGDACTIEDACNAEGSCLGDPTTCGDGVVQGECDEECDDGSDQDGDGCSGTCEIEPCFACAGEPSACNPDEGAACDDGDVCTNGDTCTALAACAGEERPRTGCRKPYQPQKAMLLIKDKVPDEADLVLFKWIRGAETRVPEFGTPTWKTDYTLCVYDESGGTPNRILKLAAPGGTTCKNNRPCWRVNRTGFNYNDADGSRGGLQKLQLKAGDAGKATVQVKARGRNLTLPMFPLDQDSTVTAQVVGSNDLCFEAEFSYPPLLNRQDFFKDKGD